MKRIRNALPMLVLAGLALQCIEPPEDPIAPSTEIQLSIPIADVRETMESLFEKDTSTVRKDGSGGYFFSDTQDAQPTRIDSIRVTPQPSGSQVGLGTFQVSAIPAQGFAVNAGALGISNWPPPPAPPTTPFPGASATLPPGSIDLSAQFDYLAVATGSLTLRVENTLPVSVFFPNPIVLRNTDNSAVVASFAFPDTIRQGEFRTATANLAGLRVSGAMRTDSAAIVFGPRPGPFTVGPSDQLDFQFSSTTIIVDSASAVVPSQVVTSIADSVIQIDDSVSVRNASFSGGRFVARIVNNLGINVGVRLSFANFRNPVTGSTLTIDRILLPRTTNDFPVRLDTVNLVDPLPAVQGSKMQFSVGIETINSGGTKAVVTSADFVRAEFIPQGDFVLRTVTGKITPTPVSVLTGASGVNLGEAADKFGGNFLFDSVRIALDLGLTGGFPIGYNLVLEARNRKTGAVDSIVVPPPAGSGTRLVTPGVGAFSTIALGNAQGLNTFLSRFVPNFPDTFIVRGNLVVNPNFDEGTLTDPTEVRQRVNVYFPLKFGIGNGALVEGISLDDGSKFPKDFSGDVRRASIRMTLSNHLPVRLAFSARAVGPLAGPGSARGTLMTIPPDGVPRVIQAAPVDVGGSVTGPIESQFEVAMTTPDIDLFNRADSLYIRLDVQTTGNGTQAVRYRATDYIRVRMSGNLIYILNKQD